jgi:hypothetical protein
MPCTQKQYSFILGGVMNTDEFTWSQDCREVKQVSLLPVFLQSKLSGNGCTSARLALNVSKIKYYAECEAEAGISISLSEACRRITEAIGV